jgi:hypothetical protein
VKIDPNHYSVVDQKTSAARKALYWLIGLAVVAALVAGGVWFMQWRSDVDAFSDVSGGVDLDVRAGRTVYVVVLGPDGGGSTDLTLDEVKPDLVYNTSQADYEVTVCRGGDAAVAEVVENPSQTCSRVVPAEDADFTLGGSAADRLLLQVTPSRQGRLVFDGFTITYSEGGKHGTETVPMDVKVLTACTLAGGEKPKPGTPYSCQ